MTNKKRLLGIAGLILVVAFVLAVVFWFRVIAPGLIKAAVEKFFSDVGTVGEVDVTVTGEVLLQDIDVPRKKGRHFAVTVDEARVRISWLYFLAGIFDERAVRNIRIDGFEVFIFLGGESPLPVHGRTGGPVTGPNPRFVPAAFRPGGMPPSARSPGPPGSLEEEYKKLIPRPPAEVPGTRPGDITVSARREYSFDCGFSAYNGEIYVERTGDLYPVGKAVRVEGDILGGVLRFSASSSTARGGKFQAGGDLAVDGSSGSAEYSLRDVDLGFLFTAFGRPRYLAEAAGPVEMWGEYAWAYGKKPFHRANGRLEDALIKLSGPRISKALTDVDANFTVTDDLIKVPAGGRFTAVGARWSAEGTIKRDYIDLVFKSERMPLQNVVDMVAGGGVSYPGEGYATIKLAGPPDDPAVYVKVAR